MKAHKRDRKYLFLINLVQKIKIVNLSWNLVPRLIRLCRTQWWYLLFLFLTGNIFYWQIWFRKWNLSNFSHNLLRPSQFLKKFLEILQCSTWQKSQAPLPSPMFQYVGRVATPKLVQHRSLCKQRWEWGKGDWSQNLWVIVK